MTVPLCGDDEHGKRRQWKLAATTCAEAEKEITLKAERAKRIQRARVAVKTMLRYLLEKKHAIAFSPAARLKLRKSTVGPRAVASANRREPARRVPFDDIDELTNEFWISLGYGW